jgi:hypothetical protein
MGDGIPVNHAMGDTVGEKGRWVYNRMPFGTYGSGSGIHI